MRARGDRRGNNAYRHSGPAGMMVEDTELDTKLMKSSGPADLVSLLDRLSGEFGRASNQEGVRA